MANKSHHQLMCTPNGRQSLVLVAAASNSSDDLRLNCCQAKELSGTSPDGDENLMVEEEKIEDVKIIQVSWLT